MQQSRNSPENGRDNYPNGIQRIQIHRLQSDNAKEFISEAFQNISRRNNIIHKYSTS